jgi:hypothetical protein
MADLIYIDLGQTVPDEGDRVVVKFVKKGSSNQYDATIWTGGSILYDPGRWPWEQALEHARKNAQHYGIKTIYAVGVPHPDRI